MPRSPKQKQKLLYIAKYFLENTDENNTVGVPRLLEYLADKGIAAERKSIYDDIETLNSFGMDIIRAGRKRDGYFLASRDFELAEVKLLVDSVQASKFITTKKSRELIAKLEGLVSKNDARKLSRQVVVSHRNKAQNENIYYSVDTIYEAIGRDCEIRFHYFEWDENKMRRLRKGGEFYEVSPWLLMWDDENYYLVAYDAGAGIMKHYRVDKMLDISLAEGKRKGKEAFAGIDIAAYSKKTFGMFAGEEKQLRLVFDNALTGVLVDRFGTETAMRRFDESHVIARVNVAVSPQFFGWLAGFGSRVRIESPEEVRQQYKDYLCDILHNY